jgi:hypothetical protein
MAGAMGLTALLVLVIKVLLALMAVVIVAVHAAWWGFGTCLPSVEFVRKAQHWLKTRWDALTELRPAASVPPADLTVAGFLAALAWPVFILANLLILAQVLEDFFPSGRRVPFGAFGTYGSFALLVGVLFSVSQTVFGLVYGEAKVRAQRVLFFCLLGRSRSLPGGSRLPDPWWIR